MMGDLKLSSMDCKQYVLFTIGGVGWASSNSSHNRIMFILHGGGRRVASQEHSNKRETSAIKPNTSNVEIIVAAILLFLTVLLY